MKIVKLQFKLSDPKETGRKQCQLVLWRGEWLSFGELTRLPEFSDLKIRPDTIYFRYRDGCRTIETLMRPTREYIYKIPVEKFDPYEGCDAVTIAALESGNNKELLTYGRKNNLATTL